PAAAISALFPYTTLFRSPETDVAAAAVLAERLRAQVEADFGSTNPRVRRPLTISIGAASLNHNLHTTEQITKAADQALYAAKNRSEEHTSELQSLRHLVC